MTQSFKSCACVYCCSCGTGETRACLCECRCTLEAKEARLYQAHLKKVLTPLPQKTWPTPRSPHGGFPARR